jgi:hypothetical protein
MRPVARYLLFPDIDRYITRFEGVVELDDVKQIAAHMWQQPEWKNRYRGVIDMRNSDLRINLRDLAILLRFFVRNSQSLSEHITLLVNTPQNTVKAMLAQSRFAEVVGISVFSMPENALPELHLSMEDFEKLDNDNNPALIRVVADSTRGRHA